MDIIKYHNDINKLKLGSFTENETDIFFSLLFKVKESKENTIIMSFSELKALANGDKNKDRFVKNILGLNVKLKSMSQTLEVEKGVFETFSLFGTIRTDTNKKTIEVPIEKKFRYLIEGIMENYTLLDLKQLVSLKGNYPKILYRLLKQFETTRLYSVKIDEFRELMGIPQTYQMINIRQKVLKPSMEELSKYFKDLELTELKKGRSVETLVFKWKNKKKKKEDIIEIQPVKKKKSVLGEKELQEHEREQLENTILELEKNKKVKNIPSDPIVELKKISKKDYENLYKDYLERLGEQHNLYMRKSFDFINKAKYEVIEDMEREQPKEKTLIFTEKDINESLLVSKTGKKLVGMARQHKIKKLLEEMNKGAINV